MAKIKFTHEFFQEWQKDPRGTCQKYGFNCDDLPQDWLKKEFWKDKSWSQYEEMMKKSRCASWFDWSA